MSIKLHKVLLIDDDRFSNYMHQYMLEDTGMFEEIEVEETALGALNKIEFDESHHLSPPEIIFVDLNMPGLNGWDFINEYNVLHSNSKKSVIAILTSSENTEDKMKALKTKNVCAYITKPLTTDKVMHVIGKYLH